MSWPDSTLANLGLLLDLIGVVLLAGSSWGFRTDKKGFRVGGTWFGQGEVGEFILARGWDHDKIADWGVWAGWTMLIVGFSLQLFGQSP